MPNMIANKNKADISVGSDGSSSTTDGYWDCSKRDKAVNYAQLVYDNAVENYEEVYIENLQKGKAFNPMDALEKQFKAQGLDKTEPELYKKIVKYRKILEQKGKSSVWAKTAACVICTGLICIGLYKYFSSKNTKAN